MNINAKEREKKEGQVKRVKKSKGIKAQRVKPYLSLGNWFAKKGKRAKQKTETEQIRNREQVPNPATPDHLVASYYSYGLYRGPTLKPAPHFLAYMGSQ